MKIGLFLLFLLILTIPLFAEFDVTGYYKSFLTTIKPPESIDLSGSGVDVNRYYGTGLSTVRITAKYDFTEHIIGEIAYGISPTVTDQKLNVITSIVGFQPVTGAFRIKDFDSDLYGKEDQINNMRIGHNLDRFALFITLPFGDLEIGRQALSFGTAKFINPTDLFSPLSFQAIDREDKDGVDIAQLRVPIGEMGELQVGYLFGKDAEFDQSGQYLRVKNMFFDYDCSATVVHFKHHILAGLDFAGTLKGASIWGEAAYLFANATDGFEQDESYLRGSFGIDYYLKFDTPNLEFYLFVEYHFNGAGKGSTDGDNDSLLKMKSEIARTDGGVYLLGQHYLMPGISYDITPLIKFTVQGIINLIDFSTLISPQIVYNIQENLYIDIGGSIPLGEESNIQYFTLNLNSEFGLYPLTIYAAMRLYF